ncbi:mitochondrial amidoxime-reducing component 1 isoform X2 [Nilaparvata lugens]|nr:mitochondrial amidoxime-reducing component 1 isoform X2 [Nilaparvata lugens]XP_022201869.2 mitochondrial amidoxime-reducing component 1 isoform X2 [Nilaparvata lugens]
MNSVNVFAAVSLSVTGSIIVFYCYVQRKRRSTWKAVGRLDNITIYPLKAGRAVFLEEAECTEFGLREVDNGRFLLRDRYFIVYEEETKNRFSCKINPIITKIGLNVRRDNILKLTCPDFDDCEFKSPSATSNNSTKSKVLIYINNESETVDCGDVPAKWLSQVILKKDSGIRLGYYDEESIVRRPDDRGMVAMYKSIFPTIKSNNLGAYAFLSSYLLINQASLDDLNSRLPPDEQPVKATNFRTNLVISGIDPYEEDELRFIRIGNDVILKYIKFCTRCVVTTLNPDTGEFNRKCEPLETLRSYRMPVDDRVNKLENWSPIFGVYFGLHKPGIIRKGDIIYIKEKNNW